VAEAHADAVSAGLLVIEDDGFAIAGFASCKEVNLVVEDTAAIQFEACEDEEEREHGAKHSPGVAAGFDEESDDDVREEGGEEGAVEEHSPELAAGFGFGDEDIAGSEISM